MRHELAKKNSSPFRIESGQKSAVLTVDAARLDVVSDGCVNVCMKYFQRQFECLSHWQKAELQALSAWVEKMSKRTPTQVKSTTKTCHRHEGGRKRPLPLGLSPDNDVYGLDVGTKQRVHGVFSGDNFFLVWLDREHRFHK